MPNRLYLDFSDLRPALSLTPVLTGSAVFGPQERFSGSVNHEYRAVDAGTVMQVQNFTTVEPYEAKFKRANLVVFQFTRSGSYRRYVGGRIDFVSPATVQISNVPETISCMSAAGQQLLGVMICFERDYLIENYGLRIDAIPTQYRRLFTSANGLPYSWTLSLSSTSWNHLDDILNCSITEPLRSVYLRAKALALVCDVVSAFNTSRVLEFKTSSAQNAERQMIDAAAAIYEREIDNPPSVSEVASRVGLHRNRLISAFQEVFNSPPAAYARQLRMQRARELLAESNLTIAQVAMSTGYTSHAAFSRAFHAHFGFPPSEAGRVGANTNKRPEHDSRLTSKIAL